MGLVGVMWSVIRVGCLVGGALALGGPGRDLRGPHLGVDGAGGVAGDSDQPLDLRAARPSPHGRPFVYTPPPLTVDQGDLAHY